MKSACLHAYIIRVVLIEAVCYEDLLAITHRQHGVSPHNECPVCMHTQTHTRIHMHTHLHKNQKKGTGTSRGNMIYQ